MAYTIVQEPSNAVVPNSQQLRERLENGSDEEKINAMESILIQVLNGDTMDSLLIHIIRFVLPSRNKTLKKLLQFYWEVIPKLEDDGKLRQEMILVCNNLRNDLQHHNEYIRGATLRLLCKLHEPELLEPLVPSVCQCLEHRYSYVRKNAVTAVYSIAQHAGHLIPDAADLLSAFLASETDATCRRNAFVALSKLDRDAAYAYFQSHHTSFSSIDEAVQLAFINFIRTDAVTHPDLLSSYLQILKRTLDSDSKAVAFEAATALATLTTAPVYLTAVAHKYIDIAVKEADNNVKVVSLKQVSILNRRVPGILSPLIMDVLLVLSTPDVDVRKQALDLAMSLITSRSVDQVVKLLKKELAASLSANYDRNAEYRQAVIGAIHKCAVQFQEVSGPVISLLLDFLNSLTTENALEVIKLIKEVVELLPSLRKSVLSQLIAALASISSQSVFLGALWVLGEYCSDVDDIEKAWIAIRDVLGPLPLRYAPQEKLDQAETPAEAVPLAAAKPRVLADGSYATETAYDAVKVVNAELHPLRKLLLSRRYFVAGTLAATLTKLVIKSEKAGAIPEHVNSIRAEGLLAMTSLLRLPELDEDTFDRVYACLQILVDGNENVRNSFVEKGHDAFVGLLNRERAMKAANRRNEKEKNVEAVDKQVRFRLFEGVDAAALTASNISNREIYASKNANDNKILSQLKHIYQLTGYSDPIYAEAHMSVNQFDIVLDVMLFNQTQETLQNLSVELYTVGDIKVIGRPSSANVPPMSFHSIKSTIRVSSADSGVIFGNIVYEGKIAQEGSVIILNDIRLNVSDYIKPAYCSELEFRQMWSDFEWENKVPVSVQNATPVDYLHCLMKQGNMACLTPGVLDKDIAKDCQFLSANLYARSTFGEDALANVSVEQVGDRVVGYVRIRAKTQGPALSIGDRVSDLDIKKK